PHAGPGVPFFDDASDSFKRAVDDFDSNHGQTRALSLILAEARVRDTLTLWHLLWRVPLEGRERVFDRMAALTPVPAGVSRVRALELDPKTLEHWREELAWTW
ncbi:MAG: hypothetical protein JOZ62_10320, partial [Acidobacteriaceae bacterium]|nr:hypothetical protein [Acidobacteriaceae bacterium]